MQLTNSFWREILDFMPDLLMLFRIDEQEQAQLMFVNDVITNLMGYKPEEFILASENASHVQTQLERLVDEIAKKTHSEEDNRGSCLFYTKQGDELRLRYVFNVIKMKSSRSPFISVVFYTDVGHTDSVAPAPKQVSKKIISESPLMKAVMNQMATQAELTTHIVFRGEASTGKSLLANHFLKMISRQGYVVYQIDTDMQEPEIVSAIKELAIISKNNEKAALLITQIERLSSKSQTILLEILHGLSGRNYPLRIIATTTKSLEMAMENGAFSTELYYALSLQHIAVPPLRKRKEDIQYYLTKTLPDLVRPLGLKNVKLTDSDIKQLLNHDWPGNWKEFFTAIRSRIAGVQEEGSHKKISTRSSEQTNSQFSMFPEETVAEAGVLSFDEMNKKYLMAVLKHTKGKIYGDDGAAHLLGLKPTTLQSKLKKLGLR